MKELDFAAVIVGPPKHGKTTIARGLVIEHVKAGGWAVIHDPNHEYEDIADCYDDVKLWRARLEKNEPMCRIASVRGKSSDITTALIELGKKHNRAKNVRLAMMDVKDEISQANGSGSTHLSDLDAEELSNRRHYGIAPIYNLQWPSQLMRPVYSLCTDVYILSQQGEQDIQTLETYLGLRGKLDPMLGVGKHKVAHWRSGEGLV